MTTVPDAADPTTANRVRARRWIRWIVPILLIAPPVAAIVTLAGHPWYPTLDLAIVDLRVRDVFGPDSPLTGLYSRPGWNHPGPLMFWGMAPLSRVTGGAPWATRIGGAVLQGAALLWLGIVTARRSTRLVLAAGTVTSFTLLAASDWLFRDPWNLFIPLPFFLLFLFLAHLAALGEVRQLIGMSIAATVIVSTHLGYTPLIVAGFAYALAYTVVDARRRGAAPERWRSTLVWCGGVWVVTWIAPVVDVALHWPGNLGKIVSYFAGDHRVVGIGSGLRFVATEFRWAPPWLGGDRMTEPLTAFALPASAAWLLVPVGLIALGALAVRATRHRDDTRLLVLAGMMLVVAVPAISRADEPLAYTFQWRATLAALLVVATAGATLRWVLAAVRRPALARRVRDVAVIAGLAATAWGTVTMTAVTLRDASRQSDVRAGDLRAVARALDHRPPTDREIRVRAVGPSLPALSDGVIDELDRRGVRVRVDPELGRIFGSRRALAPGAPRPTWYVTEAGSLIPGLSSRRGARVLVATTPLLADDERELARLQATIGRALDAAHRPDLRVWLDSPFAGFRLAFIPGIAKSDLARLVASNVKVERSGRCRCAVVIVPTRPAP